MNKYCETAMKKYYETVLKVLRNSNENYYETAPKKVKVKVDFIPPIREYELGLCALSAGGGLCSVHNVFKEYFGLSSNCSHQ